jgi:cellulose synthase/poly-beta-1,6-N-acetylglucosamine synthase-like glycosyltransferase
VSDPGVHADPLVSVVICAYTEARWDDLLAAIASVDAQRERVPLEIVVVIDHNPALLERMRTVSMDLRLDENVQARGLSGARNSGVLLARGRIVAFMDDDAVADPGWLEALVATYDDPSVAGAGGTIRPMWETGRPSWWPPEFDWVVGCTYRGMPLRRAVVRNVIGCNMSFRRDLLQTVGGFAHGIGRIGTRPLGAEETELSIRVGKRWPERSIVYEPAAIVDHRVPAERATFRYFRSRCYAEGISKAAVSKLVGTGEALATERGYAARTLGRAVLAELGSALRGNAAGLSRATAIVAGLAITTAGYLVGAVSARVTTLPTHDPAESVEP